MAHSLSLDDMLEELEALPSVRENPPDKEFFDGLLQEILATPPKSVTELFFVRQDIHPPTEECVLRSIFLRLHMLSWQAHDPSFD